MKNDKKCVICGGSLSGRQRKYCSKKCERKSSYERHKKKENRDSRLYQQNNKEKIREYNKQYREDNKEYFKQYRKDNKEKIKKERKEYKKNNKEKIREGNKKYYKNNKEKISECQKRHREENKERIKKREKELRELNKEKIKVWQKKYRANNKEKIKEYRSSPTYRLNNSISGSLRESLKSNNLSKNRRKWEDLVGYTVQELKDHLESLFIEGMTWENYGFYGWHIDHIIPLSFFIFTSTDDVEFKYCWSLDNLQPLWAPDNWSKNNKIDNKYFQ